MCQTLVNLILTWSSQGPSGTKVPRLAMCRSILSLGKTAHQMWCDHSFSQKIMTTERATGLGVGGDK